MTEQQQGPQGSRTETIVVSVIGLAIVSALWVWFLLLATR